MKYFSTFFFGSSFINYVPSLIICCILFCVIEYSNSFYSMNISIIILLLKPSLYWTDPSLSRFQGQATDIAIQAEEILKLKKMLNEIYSRHTGKDVEIIGKHFFFVDPLAPRLFFTIKKKSWHCPHLTS